jgi:hypothetical protein
MRVTIKGSATSEHFKQIVDSLNEEFSKFGIRVRNATCYFRFENEAGELVEPVDKYGNEVSRIITFRRSVTVPEEKKKTKKSKTKEVKEK